MAALVDSLRYDPFYVTITAEFAANESLRCHALARYFDYSMSEGARKGRLVVWPDPAVGAAVWLLPAEPSVYQAESMAKAEFLAETLGTTAKSGLLPAAWILGRGLPCRARDRCDLHDYAPETEQAVGTLVSHDTPARLCA